LKAAWLERLQGRRRINVRPSDGRSGRAAAGAASTVTHALFRVKDPDPFL